jgi:hypothetical protein
VTRVPACFLFESKFLINHIFQKVHLKTTRLLTGYSDHHDLNGIVRSMNHDAGISHKRDEFCLLIVQHTVPRRCDSPAVDRGGCHKLGIAFPFSDIKQSWK